MDDSQRRITVLDGIHNDPHREQIVNLVQRLMLVDHLLVNAEKMFDPSADFSFDAGGFDLLFHIVHDAVNECLAFLTFHVDILYKIIISFRLKIF